MLRKYVLLLALPAFVQAAQVSEQQFGEMWHISSRDQLNEFLGRHNLQLGDIINLENPADDGHTLISCILGASGLFAFNFYSQNGAETLRLFAYLMTQGADLTKQAVQNHLPLARYFTVVARSANPVETAERIIALEASLHESRVTGLEQWGLNQGANQRVLRSFASRPQGPIDRAVELVPEQLQDNEKNLFSWQNITMAASIGAAVYFFVSRDPKKDVTKQNSEGVIKKQ
jgi:hypothetical protein